MAQEQETKSDFSTLEAALINLSSGILAIADQLGYKVDLESPKEPDDRNCPQLIEIEALLYRTEQLNSVLNVISGRVKTITERISCAGT